MDKVGIIATSFIVLLLGFFLVVFVLVHKRKQSQNRVEKQLMHSKFQQELLNATLEIQEQTFQNISQEIHDNIGQVLTLAKLNLNTVGAELPPSTHEKILSTKELVAKAINDLRDLSKSLNPDMIREVGLCEAINRDLSLLSKSGQHQVLNKIDGTPFRLDKQKELILFRIFQELLNNIIKHAQANTVIIRLNYTPQAFNLTVSDDGQGFDAGSISTSGSKFGLGLRNMHSRANLIGAKFQLSSTLGKGTTVSIELPIEKATGNYERATNSSSAG
jgi:two-component system, NarL family, sensor kinase